MQLADGAPGIDADGAEEDARRRWRVGVPGDGRARQRVRLLPDIEDRRRGRVRARVTGKAWARAWTPTPPAARREYITRKLPPLSFCCQTRSIEPSVVLPYSACRNCCRYCN